MVQHDFPIDHDVERTSKIVIKPLISSPIPRADWISSHNHKDQVRMLETSARRSFRTDPNRNLVGYKTPFPYCFCTSSAPPSYRYHNEAEDTSTSSTFHLFCFGKWIKRSLAHDKISHYTPKVDTPSSLKRVVRTVYGMWNSLIIATLSDGSLRVWGFGYDNQVPTLEWPYQIDQSTSNTSGSSLTTRLREVKKKDIYF